jgi:hypothetical protein
MRKDLLAGLCGLVLWSATAVQAIGQENRTPDKQDKSTAEKTADKAKDVKDKTVKGAKAAGEKTKDIGAEVGDKAGDAKDATVKGTKVAAGKTKDVAADAADKGEDVGKKTAKGAKSAGNWFTRAFKKIF